MAFRRKEEFSLGYVCMCVCVCLTDGLSTRRISYIKLLGSVHTYTHTDTTHKHMQPVGRENQSLSAEKNILFLLTRSLLSIPEERVFFTIFLDVSSK